jgi:glycine oxidase ThiO
MAANCYDRDCYFPCFAMTTRTTDIIVIGGGIIGLSIALELHWRGLTVRVLTKSSSGAAASAAAGMLAPQAEEIPPSAMLDFCLWSRSLYPEWTRKLSALTGLDTGYWPCGILGPRYQSPPQGQTEWQDRPTLLHKSGTPNLGSEVVGGYWFPADGQVDNRALYRALQVATQSAGIEVLEGITIEPFDERPIQELITPQGTLQADRYILATGAWSEQLLPIPVQPRKGQMLALQVPPNQPLPLHTVLFGEEVYIVPRRDGRIIIGATSENVGFQPGNSNADLEQLRAKALRLCPDLAAYPVVDRWWGFRPSTPDELPILGASDRPNLILATGHYRNGILLAPATAQIIADYLCHQPTPLLPSFSYQRFSEASSKPALARV